MESLLAIISLSILGVLVSTNNKKETFCAAEPVGLYTPINFLPNSTVPPKKCVIKKSVFTSKKPKQSGMLMDDSHLDMLTGVVMPYHPKAPQERQFPTAITTNVQNLYTDAQKNYVGEISYNRTAPETLNVPNKDTLSMNSATIFESSNCPLEYILFDEKQSLPALISQSKIVSHSSNTEIPELFDATVKKHNFNNEYLVKNNQFKKEFKLGSLPDSKNCRIITNNIY